MNININKTTLDIYLLNILRNETNDKTNLYQLGNKLAGIYCEILELTIKPSLKENLTNLLEILNIMFKDNTFKLIEIIDLFVISHDFVSVVWKDVGFGVVMGYLEICLLECKVIGKKGCFLVEKKEVNLEKM
ncbi:hypothetical protein CDIK_2010 [Cucumispora dikerogammari]|nr:hypothetical protein CDIK_2010 [Cucumispora dikerogammari]